MSRHSLLLTGARAWVLALSCALALACVVLEALLIVSPAIASFGPIELQSVGPRDQFEAAGESALSADGRYLVFQGSLDGEEGVYRKDLQTGALEKVAGSGAFGPSISADGRYVSFTSDTALVQRVSPGLNVYARDMNVPLPPAEAQCTVLAERHEDGETCPFELASARDGDPEGYPEGVQVAQTGAVPIGAVASPRVALSADGRKVAFVTEGQSDLTSAHAGEMSTPPLQVALRDLDTDTTVLVSQTTASLGASEPEPVSGGAVTPTAQQGTVGPTQRPGAALSADGSTVAWLGAHIPAQAPMLADERSVVEQDDEKAVNDEAYDEPLWRRIGDGLDVPTRRIVGGGDPLAPGCPPEGTLQTPACQGPFPQLISDSRDEKGSHNGWLAFTSYDGVPQLSADGWTVALIGDPRPADPPSGDEGGTSNVFVVDMHEDLSRVAALHQLTREQPIFFTANPGTQPEYVSTAGDVYDVGISPDGGKVAFTTQRQQFQLSPLNLTEPPLAQLGTIELYQVSLVGMGLQRVTHGPGEEASLEGNSGTVSSRGAAMPAYSMSDGTLAFSDTASNLVGGDANRASDVFTVSQFQSPALPGPVEIAPPPQQSLGSPQWRLSVVAGAHSGGTIVLEATVPGAGELVATARSSLPAVSARRSHAGKPAKNSGRARPSVVADRVIATARLRTTAAGLVVLRLRLASRFTRFLDDKTGIYALIHVDFSGLGGRPLVQTLAISLHGPRVKHMSRKRRAASRKRGAAGSRGRVGGKS